MKGHLRAAERRRSRTFPTVGILGTLAVLCLALPVHGADGVLTAPLKIDPEISRHAKEKARVASLAPGSRAEALSGMGLAPGALDAEECAMYVETPLTAADIAGLQSQGITVHPTYVPPVPGHHKQGFYLATVSYGSLGAAAASTRIARLGSAEALSHPGNDVAAQLIRVDRVHTGHGTTARTGAGVKVAVADSGIQLNHGDFPVPVEAYDMTDGTGIGSWGTNVSNTVIDHGTHVTGSVLGRGTLSGGKYKGMAPGASLLFYKIGNDVNAGATEADQIEAIQRAVAAGAKIFTMSYYGVGTFQDGSTPMCQAVDAAVAAGVTVFMCAGNDAASNWHDSASVAPGANVTGIGYKITNPSNSIAYTTPEYIRLIWRDNASGDFNVTPTVTNLGAGELLSFDSYNLSSRGTDSSLYHLTPNIPAGGSKTYTIRLDNSAVSGTTPVVQLFTLTGYGVFTSPDPFYTIGNPAVADGAIAVGAWTSRNSWTNFQGSNTVSPETVGTLASFSSRGPRVDGTLKPDIVAPGSYIISTRDITFGTTVLRIIDNDGSNLNGSGPANYFAEQGTSMATPIAAGVAALFLEANPGATPAQVRAALTSTASIASSPSNSIGYGLIDALLALGGNARANSAWLKLKE